MLKISGFNLIETCAESVTINGAYISAKLNNKELVSIRDIDMPEWYDEKHLRVMRAIQELEDALRDIINTSESAKPTVG